MPIRAGVGFSDRRNPNEVAEQVVKQALEELGEGGPPDFAVLLVTVGHRVHNLVAKVRAVLGDVPLIGCTGEGVISSAGITEGAHGAALALYRSDTLRFLPFAVGGMADDVQHVGREVAAHVQSRLAEGPPVGLLILADGLRFNFTAFSRGLYDDGALDPTIPMFGGMAGDNFAFKKTEQFMNDQTFDDGVVGALLVGEADLDIAVTHGCTPIGVERTVTAADGNVILTIDDRPALDVVREYLGDDTDEENWGRRIASLAVGIRSERPASDSDEEFTIRFFTGMDAERGALTVSEEVAVGTPFWVTQRNVDKIEAGNRRIVEKLAPGSPDTEPAFLFHFDCAGRGTSFVPEPKMLEMVRFLRNGIAPRTPWLGMFSFGELAPVEGVNLYHSFTAVAATLR